MILFSSAAVSLQQQRQFSHAGLSFCPLHMLQVYSSEDLSRERTRVFQSVDQAEGWDLRPRFCKLITLQGNLLYSACILLRGYVYDQFFGRSSLLIYQSTLPIPILQIITQQQQNLSSITHILPTRTSEIIIKINNQKMQTSNKWQQYSCLHPQLITTLYGQGFSNPTSIQAEVFENYRHYYDFLIASQTGSGKTLAFAAPIVSELVGLTERGGLPKKPLCLILTPTRELALQIEQVFDFLLKDTPINKICILGGLSAAKQLRIMHEQSPHIIIGTPGRIHELLNQGEINFQVLKFLVIDEADRMIEMGHYVELDQILNKIFEPKVKETFEEDFEEINQRLGQEEQGEYFILENGKKKKIKFNINSIQTDKLFEVPMQLFQVEGSVPIKQAITDPTNVPAENKKKKKKKHQENPETQPVEPTKQQTEQLEQVLAKMKRRVFFISATLTRQFKGTKYFIKKNRPLEQDQKKSKSKDKKDKKGKKQQKQQQNQYIPKLKALLSRIKFDAKPKIIDQSSQIFLPAKLKQKFAYCQSDIDKITIILCYINELPQNSKIIIFTNTIRASKRVKFFIQAAGLRAVSLHSHMIQKQRLDKLQKFQKSKANILISTDVAARGLDFMITNVIQYSVPINGDTYVHRVGRTARANREGQALVLISEKEATRWEEISDTIQTADPNRKLEKYCPLQSSYQTTKTHVQQYEFIRLNQQKQQNKRIQKLNQMQAQQFGLEAQQNEKVKPKRIADFQEQQRLEKQRIQKQIRDIRIKNNRERKAEAVVKKPEVGDGKVWKKNKLVMTLDEIKKYL